MSITVTATQAAREFSELLSRVRYRGEEFVIERGGEPVALLSPAPNARGVTFGDLCVLIAEHGVDDDFASDLEQIQAMQGPMPEDPWRSS